MYLCNLLHQLSSLCLSSGGMSPWFLKHPTHKFPYITTIIYYISRAVVFLPQIAYKSLKTALVTPPGWFPSIRLVWSFPCLGMAMSRWQPWYNGRQSSPWCGAMPSALLWQVQLNQFTSLRCLVLWGYSDSPWIPEDQEFRLPAHHVKWIEVLLKARS